MVPARTDSLKKAVYGMAALRPAGLMNIVLWKPVLGESKEYKVHSFENYLSIESSG